MSLDQSKALRLLTTPLISQVEELSAKQTDPREVAASLHLQEVLRKYPGKYLPATIELSSSDVTILQAGWCHTGSRSVIHQGYHQGHLVAVKEVKLDLGYSGSGSASEQAAVEQMYRVRPSALEPASNVTDHSIAP